MSNKTQSDGFGWDELWAGYRNQPLYIQQEWMQGYLNGSSDGKKYRNEGLHVMLIEIMSHGSKKVQEEVFEFAPEDIQIYYKYKQSPNPKRCMDNRTKQMIQQIFGA